MVSAIFFLCFFLIASPVVSFKAKKLKGWRIGACLGSPLGMGCFWKTAWNLKLLHILKYELILKNLWENAKERK